MTIDERFTEIADRLTETIGKWYFTVISLLFLIGWILYGMIAIPSWFTSTTWNFPINSISTIAEFFFELWILAAACRVERRNQALMEKIEALVEREEGEIEQLAHNAHPQPTRSPDSRIPGKGDGQ